MLSQREACDAAGNVDTRQSLKGHRVVFTAIERLSHFKIMGKTRQSHGVKYVYLNVSKFAAGLTAISVIIFFRKLYIRPALLCRIYCQNAIHTFPRNFHVDGEVANLLRTYRGLASGKLVFTTDFGLMQYAAPLFGFSVIPNAWPWMTLNSYFTLNSSLHVGVKYLPRRLMLSYWVFFIILCIFSTVFFSAILSCVFLSHFKDKEPAADVAYACSCAQYDRLSQQQLSFLMWMRLE